MAKVDFYYLDKMEISLAGFFLLTGHQHGLDFLAL